MKYALAYHADFLNFKPALTTQSKHLLHMHPACFEHKIAYYCYYLVFVILLVEFSWSLYVCRAIFLQWLVDEHRQNQVDECVTN